MTSGTIALMAGDGIGPEVMAEAVKVLAAISTGFGVPLETFDILIGGAAVDTHGVPLRAEDIERCRHADAILLGAVGGPKWEQLERERRPEQGLLTLRKALGLYANLRPVTVMEALIEASPVKAELVRGVDLIVVRELTGGLYFGRPSRQSLTKRGRSAVDTLRYDEHEIARVARLAFELARERRKKVASVDKQNVLQTSRLWRTVVTEIAADYPDVELEHVLVDAMAMHLVRSPARFDVIVTENMFGDILTDEASVLAGSIGLLPSASLGEQRGDGGRRFGLYEPIHGSAPDIAGQGKANPIGTILSAAMLLRTSLGLEEPARAIEQAVADTIDTGLRTPDLVSRGTSVATTSAVGDAIVAQIIGG